MTKPFPLPDAHWGYVGKPLPPVEPPGDDEPDDDGEDITEADPDVIAMLGFDPFELDGEDEALAHARRPGHAR